MSALTGWHVIAFLGELVLWGCAAWAGWTLGSGGLRWVLSGVLLVAIITAWALWAAPRAPRRLRRGPRLTFIAALGLLIAGLFLPVGEWAGVGAALAATAAVVVAQGFDAPGH